MKTYTVIYAEDVPHYGSRAFEAADDDAAIKFAIEIDPDVMSAYTLDADHNWPQNRRIVTITGPDGIIGEDIDLDKEEASSYNAGQKESVS